MKVTLFDFQEDALRELNLKLNQARAYSSSENPQAISFSAPTGAGKTIVMTALFENILFGDVEIEAQPDAAILWISDIPELNEQTRLKIEGKSDRIRVRQLVTIDSSFDAERLEGGHVYFINTQKLGTEKLLTRTGDTRQYTLWETLTNTAMALPDRFYVVIDEAHRGMQRSTRENRNAETILQKFLLGSPEDGMGVMPLVIGVSATPQRFDALLQKAKHSTHKVHVNSDEVRASGLLKDRILIHFPKNGKQTEMSLLAEAVQHWKRTTEAWEQFTQDEGLERLRPILVIQVEDVSGNAITGTDLDAVVATLEGQLGRPLAEGELAHTFTEHSSLAIDEKRVRYIEPSRIDDDPRVHIVLFKMALSTGWDCPRAEVMMSFRRAQDHTYIAQLLGRMVRAPLARRIEKNAALNDVHLYLPHYDEKTVEQVINDLQNVEDVPPAIIITSRESVILFRRPDTEKIFEVLAKLVTYRVNAVRQQSALVRLMKLGRNLTQDQIDEDAQDGVKQGILREMAQQIDRLRTSENYAERTAQFTGIDIKTVALEGGVIAEDSPVYAISAAQADIERLFAQAGRRLSNGLHMEYWRAHAGRDALDVKLEVIILSRDDEAMAALEEYCQAEFNQLYSAHKQAISALGETRRSDYNQVRLAAAEPTDIPWVLPEQLTFRRSPGALEFEKHLYLEANGKFHADLGTWERGVLEEELGDERVVGWLRNVDRQTWSLEIPYQMGGQIRPMFPDLLVVRKDSSGFLFDILEPHDPSKDDNAAKALGLARFAERHWHLFGRIQLIRKQKSPAGSDRFYRLPIDSEPVRRELLAIKSNDELNQIFEEHGKLR